MHQNIQRFKVISGVLLLSAGAFSSYANASVDLMVENAEELKKYYSRGEYTPKSKRGNEGLVEVERPKRSVSEVPARETISSYISNQNSSERPPANDPVFTTASELKETKRMLVEAPLEKPVTSPETDRQVQEILDQPAPQPPPSYAPDVLQGIVFIQDENLLTNGQTQKLYEEKFKLDEQRIQMIGFENERLRKTGLWQAGFLQDYIGQKIDLTLINNIIQQIKEITRNSTLPFTNIYAPPQDIKNGIVFIVITPALVEDIQIAESKYFNEQAILSGIDQELGEPVNTTNLDRDMAVLSLHPDRQVKASFSPGSQPNTTFVNIDIEEQKPWRLFSSLSNTGTKDLDEEQITVGAYHNNLFGWEHQVFYQYLTSLDRKSLKAHNASYQIPLTRQQDVSLQFSDSQTQSALLDGAFETKGSFRKWGGRYSYKFLDTSLANNEWNLTGQKLSAGVDYKNIEGDILFTLFGEPLNTGIGADVEVINGVIEYVGRLEDPFEGVTEFDTRLVYSPGNISPDNSDENFVTARANTNSDYIYLRASAERAVPLSLTYKDKPFLFYHGVNAQYSPDRLIGSERFVDSSRAGFRGYEPGIFSGDSGASGYVELGTSPYNIISNEYIEDSLQGRVFSDVATFINHHPADFEERSETLVSIGASVDYQINEKISSKFTVAQDLSNQRDETHQNIMYRLFINY